jgi:hypothetical protein
MPDGYLAVNRSGAPPSPLTNGSALPACCPLRTEQGLKYRTQAVVVAAALVKLGRITRERKAWLHAFIQISICVFQGNMTTPRMLLRVGHPHHYLRALSIHHLPPSPLIEETNVTHAPLFRLIRGLT